MRWISGIVFLAASFLIDMAAGWRLAAYVVGITAILTALGRYCPVNAALGVDSRRKRRTVMT